MRRIVLRLPHVFPYPCGWLRIVRSVSAMPAQPTHP